MGVVRRAVPEDIPKLLLLAKEEHGQSRFAKVPFDEQRAEQTFRVFIDGMATVVIISDHGFIMGMVQPLVFSKFWNAYEMAWFASDGSGLALLSEFIKWAEGMRAIDVVVHNYAGITNEEQFSKVMERKGFGCLGSSYIKQIGEL